MDLEFTPAMLEDPATMAIANMLLVNIVDTASISDNSVYTLSKSKEKLLDKLKIEKLVGIGTRFSGTMHLYAEVDDDVLDKPVPPGFKHSEKKGEDGEVIGTRPWNEQSLVKRGNKGKSLIRFVNKIGANGDPVGMTHEDFLLFIETFPNFIDYVTAIKWGELNTAEDIG